MTSPWWICKMRLGRPVTVGDLDQLRRQWPVSVVSGMAMRQTELELMWHACVGCFHGRSAIQRAWTLVFTTRPAPMQSGWLNGSGPRGQGPQRHHMHGSRCLVVSHGVGRMTNLRLAKSLGRCPLSCQESWHRQQPRLSSRLGSTASRRCPSYIRRPKLTATDFACFVAAPSLRRRGFRVVSCLVIFGRDPEVSSLSRIPEIHRLRQSG